MMDSLPSQCFNLLHGERLFEQVEKIPEPWEQQRFNLLHRERLFEPHTGDYGHRVAQFQSPSRRVAVRTGVVVAACAKTNAFQSPSRRVAVRAYASLPFLVH